MSAFAIICLYFFIYFSDSSTNLCLRIFKRPNYRFRSICKVLSAISDNFFFSVVLNKPGYFSVERPQSVYLLLAKQSQAESLAQPVDFTLPTITGCHENLPVSTQADSLQADVALPRRSCARISFERPVQNSAVLCEKMCSPKSWLKQQFFLRVSNVLRGMEHSKSQAC